MGDVQKFFQKLKDQFKVEQYLLSDESKAVEKDSLWKPKDALWIIFLSKAVPQGLPKDILSGFLLQKSWKIGEVKGASLTAENTTLKRSIEASFGFNENQERMVHIKCKDEQSTTLSTSAQEFYRYMLLEYADYLAKNHMLRSQTFDPQQAVTSFQQLYETMVKEQLKVVINKASVYEAKDGVFVIFLNKSSREDIRGLLIDHCSESGLTCKLEGKATVKGASSVLSVILRIGFNDQNERMLHCQNDVSFLGGDKQGSLFKEFCRKLVWKMAEHVMLKDQQTDSKDEN